MSVKNKGLIVILCKILHNGFKRGKKCLKGCICVCNFFVHVTARARAIARVSMGKQVIQFF